MPLTERNSKVPCGNNCVNILNSINSQDAVSNRI